MRALGRILITGLLCLAAGAPAASAAGLLRVDAFGATGNGVVDDTTAVQAALNAAPAGGTVTFTPGKTYRIGGTLTGLVPKSQTHVVAYGATLVSENQAGGRCRLFTIAGKNRITISGGTYIGYRTGAPEWAVGIHVSDSSGITIEDGTFRDFYTDAVTVTGNVGSTRVVIRRCRVTNAGRNGMSLIGGSDISVEDSVFENTSNTDTNMPRAGLEAEPNADNSLVGIVVTRCHFRNNQGSGLLFQIGHGRVLSGITLKDNVAENNGIGGLILTGGVTNALIQSNRVTGHTNRNGYGIALTRRAAYVVVKGNVLENNYRGIYCEGCEGGAIDGNTIVGTGTGTTKGQGDDGDGIHLRSAAATVDGAPVTYPSRLITISNNIIRNMAGRGILCGSTAQLAVADNVIADSGQHGIQLRFSSADSLVQGNIVSRSGLEAVGAYQHLFVSQGSARTIVTQNQLRDSGVMAGVALDNATHTTVTQNCLIAGPATPLSASVNATGTSYEWRGAGVGWNRTQDEGIVGFVPQEPLP